MTILPIVVIPKYLAKQHTRELADIEVSYLENKAESLDQPRYEIVEVFSMGVCLTEIISDNWMRRLHEEVTKILNSEEQARIFEERQKR